MIILTDGTQIEIESGGISDGYHTFDELYEHRCALFAALATHNPELGWKSRRHYASSSYPGWFIAGMRLPPGPITYHLPDRFWEIVRVPEQEYGDQWDGHTPDDVIQRLRRWN